MHALILYLSFNSLHKPIYMCKDGPRSLPQAMNNHLLNQNIMIL